MMIDPEGGAWEEEQRPVDGQPAPWRPPGFDTGCAGQTASGAGGGGFDSAVARRRGQPNRAQPVCVQGTARMHGLERYVAAAYRPHRPCARWTWF